MSDTPNVVVQNPTVRRVANWVIGIALIVFPTAVVLEANTTFDFSAWLPAALAVTSFLAGAFGLAVTTPNVPRPDVRTVTEREADEQAELSRTLRRDLK